MRKKSTIASILLVAFGICNCTNLEEKYPGNLTSAQKNNSGNATSISYDNLINSLKAPFQNPYGDVISLSEITTDELITPTRGNDWGDNGIWRALHQHQWNADHILITGCFNDLSGVVFAATDFLQFSPSPQQEAEARFYRAWAMYWMLDFFNQVPYRDPGKGTVEPAKVRTGMEALNYIVSEIKAVMENLSEGPPTSPTKNAARVLLMKCYLNKGVYANRQSPSFHVNDMNQVISLADEVINSNQYTFSDNYFDNFAPDNTNLGKENIFTQENVGGNWGNSSLFYYTLFPLSYTSTPFGYNGFTTLSDFYDKFQASDKRRGQSYRYPGSFLNPGNRTNVGFLIDQQYNLETDEPLNDGTSRKLPLVYTPYVKIIESDSNLRVTGIRPIKYAADIANRLNPGFYLMDNDWVYLRLPDVLLMKAEAILHDGTATEATYGSSALELVNSIRTHPSRAASALTSIDLDGLLNERGRELWLECWRRQDLIRFGKFLDPFQQKPDASDPKYLLFPIPSQQLAVNKENLTQNPGY